MSSMSKITAGMREIPACWELKDAVVAAVLGEVTWERTDRARLTSVVRGVTRSWYADERSGFNAEHIAIGGEG